VLSILVNFFELSIYVVFETEKLKQIVELQYLHVRAGTLASLSIYYIKTKSRLSVCIFCCHAANSVISAWIHLRLSLSDSYGLWHEQVCFYKFLRPLSWAQERLKEAAVALFRFHFASRKFAKHCNFTST